MLVFVIVAIKGWLELMSNTKNLNFSLSFLYEFVNMIFFKVEKLKKLIIHWIIYANLNESRLNKGNFHSFFQ